MLLSNSTRLARRGILAPGCGLSMDLPFVLGLRNRTHSCGSTASRGAVSQSCVSRSYSSRQKLAFGRTLYTLFFDSKGSSVHTEMGTLSLDPSPSFINFVSSAVASTSQQPHYNGYGINADGTWIIWNSERVLRLSPEYRPTTSAVAGSMVVLVCLSGRVLIWQFSPDPLIGVGIT
jgi:hypothetical protein